MADFQDKLEQQADLLFKNVEGWNTNALKRIGRRVKEIGSLSHADLQALNNATIVEKDINAIISELANLTEQSAPEVVRIYADALKDQHLENKPLYDYRNKPFIPFYDNKELQAIVKAYARTTMGTMVGLSMTKGIALGTVNKLGKFTPLERSFKDVLDKAVIAVTTGTGDFNSEMRDAIRELGGSGMRIDYGGGITRRVESMVRQNLLWGAKQASVEYNEMIGEELGCDGIEVDWHSNPRPSHEFMQGKQFSLNGKKTIKGITYEDATPAIDALQDYGCLHYKTPIILGVSEPRYSPEELKRLNEENARPITIDGVTKTGYQWKQTMRQFEREARYTKEKMELFNASGDKSEVKRLRQHLKGVEERYYKIADGSGIKAQPGRMAYTKGVSKVVDNSAKSGIINSEKFNSIGDPMLEVTGPAELSHPEEIKAFRKEIENNGVKLIESTEEKLAYSPGMRKGQPGTLYISKGSSFSAWCHEMQHMRDDAEHGWSGMRILQDLEECYSREEKAYQIEIDMANEINRQDIVKRLQENLEKERKKIYGL